MARLACTCVATQTDVSQVDNFNEDLYSGLIIFMFIVPIVLALVMVAMEFGGPFVEEWRQEAQRRKRIGMDAISFKAYLQQMLKRDADNAYEVWGLGCLAVGAALFCQCASLPLSFSHGHWPLDVTLLINPHAPARPLWATTA